ncbi:MAG: hypothetical protein HFG79_15785 [Lachnospiraceae bacterium]|jgi:hypothetical protein|nr:hypothetical protein [Lachnospiraceae bacterium]
MDNTINAARKEEITFLGLCINFIVDFLSYWLLYFVSGFTLGKYYSIGGRRFVRGKIGEQILENYVNKSSPIFLLVVGARMIYHKGRKSL